MRFAELENGRLPVKVRHNLTLEELATVLLSECVHARNPEGFIDDISRQELVQMAIKSLALGGTLDILRQQRLVSENLRLRKLCQKRVKEMFGGIK